MLTIEPRPASHIAGPKTWVALKTPATLTFNVSRKPASSLAPGGTSMPALLTSTVGVPCSAATSLRRRSSDPRSVTSPWKTPSPSRISTPTTVAPASASAAVQTGPSVPSAPVTTAMWPSRRSALIFAAQRRAGRLERIGEQILEVLERQRRILRDRMAQRAPDHGVQLVRRQPVAGRLQPQVLAAQHVARGERGGGDDLLAHLPDRIVLARIRRFRPVAERDVRAMEVANELAQPDRLQREAVVGALHRAV